MSKDSLQAAAGWPVRGGMMSQAGEVESNSKLRFNGEMFAWLASGGREGREGGNWQECLAAVMLVWPHQKYFAR